MAARCAALPERSARRSSACSENSAASAHEQNADAAVSEDKQAADRLFERMGRGGAPGSTVPAPADDADYGDNSADYDGIGDDARHIGSI